MNRLPPNHDSQGSDRCTDQFFCFCHRCESATELLLADMIGLNFQSLQGRHLWATMKLTWSIQSFPETVPVYEDDGPAAPHGWPDYPCKVNWELVPYSFHHPYRFSTQ